MRAKEFHRRHYPVRHRPLPGWVSVNYRCGLHSGFPKCCIRFFVRNWMLGSHEQIRVHAARLISASIRMNKWPGYIPCPDCLLKQNIVEVLDCPLGSHQAYSCGAYMAPHRVHQRRGFVAKRHRSL